MAGSLFLHIMTSGRKKLHDRTTIMIGARAKDNTPDARVTTPEKEYNIEPDEIKEKF